jgi:hypothetical protein
MDFTDDEQRTLLAGLFELSINRGPDPAIEALVVRLGGDPNTVFFHPRRADEPIPPAPAYPADETDEA